MSYEASDKVDGLTKQLECARWGEGRLKID